MMKYNIVRILIVLLFLSNLPVLSKAQVPLKVPAFRIRNLEGVRFDSRKQLGHSLVVSFFFTRCPPCIKEMPELYEFMRQEGRLKQLLFVDVYVDALKITEKGDTEREIKKFVKKLKIPLQNIYFDEIGSLLKNFSQIDALPQAKKMGTKIIFPSILVIDANGKLVLTMEGSKQDFIEKIKAVL